MEDVVKCGLPEGYTLDGELYHHGTPLQRITSWVKREQLATLDLVYMVYDVIPDDLKWGYGTRFGLLNELEFTETVQLAPTLRDVEEADIPMYLKGAIDAGYEGLILRRDGFPYADGKRSKALVKIKQWMDDEFEVIGIVQSKEGYAILNCVTDDGVEFDATAPGSMDEKHETWRNRDEFIGLTVNVKFANYTIDGVPFHPIATGWRDKDDE